LNHAAVEINIIMNESTQKNEISDDLIRICNSSLEFSLVLQWFS